MSISGFTMGRNQSSLYYPVCQSVRSILPLVDEFIIALGACDNGDQTEKNLRNISSNKIKINHTTWDLQKFPNGMENAHQTDIAKSHCKGDWCFYLQADEVVHEKDLETIEKACMLYKGDKRVDGFLFNYYHFWGDYNHVHDAHGWYKKEIRIVRNDPDIHSWKSAQSFRRIPNFDGRSYRRIEGTFKLNVIQLPVNIYHYGWVRPPRLMRKKSIALDTIHKGSTEALNKNSELDFNYGKLNRIPRFKGTHPAVMKEWIAKMDWKSDLNSQRSLNRKKFKHERLKYQILTQIEKMIGFEIGATNNYRSLGKFR